MLLTQCGNVALMYFLPLLLRNALYGPDAAPVPPGALTAGDSHAHELVRLLPRGCQELLCMLGFWVRVVDWSNQSKSRVECCA